MALCLSDLPGTWTVAWHPDGHVTTVPGEHGSSGDFINIFHEGRHTIAGYIGMLPAMILLPKEHFHEFGPDTSTQEHRN